MRERTVRVRTRLLRLLHRLQAPHLGSALSVVDALTVLFDATLRLPAADDPSRPIDRLVLSKGHAVAALYVVLTEYGWLPPEMLDDCSIDAVLWPPVDGDVVGRRVVSTGPGRGLAIAVGQALALRRAGGDQRVFVILGDVESGSGLVAEAGRLAADLELDNLIAVIDDNADDSTGRHRASRVDLAARFTGLGWGARSVDGHDFVGLRRALGRLPYELGRPSALVARTSVGAGVSFMESQAEWRDRTLDRGDLRRALAELSEE